MQNQANSPSTVNAVVVGAGGGLGTALVQALQQRNGCRVFALSREPHKAGGANPTWLQADPTEPESLAHAADTVRRQVTRVHLLAICVGILHGGEEKPGLGPEKALSQLDGDNFRQVMTVNALAPLQVLAAFSDLLRHDQRAVAVALSAMVGSIGDNRLGGWYSYRMSKAALNMGLRNAAIELNRPAGGKQLGPIVAAIHPGTTTTPLSAPFLRRHAARPAAESAAHILDVIDRLSPDDNGAFFNWDGRELPW
ncbi:MAG: SDR family NAD(P)-dependent oxidoreductase [Gammaproteobacteria bacterium]|nr:SDR family NAD(P)-dependent oxidoreductase [Gammaproteobacteria bacterium]